MKVLLLALLFVFLRLSVAAACDLCSVYSSIEGDREIEGDLKGGVSHQFIHYESNVKPLGKEQWPGQYIESNNTQLYFGYNLTERFALQLNLPIIYRDFRRIRDGKIDEGTESGIGDLALLAKYRPYRYAKADTLLAFDTFLGLKLPTGDSDRLKEVQGESEERSFLRHGDSQENLVGGDYLALGSGSYDWILGASFFSQYYRSFFSASLQYAIRQEGDFGYHYGDDLQWTLGPGYYVMLNHEDSLSLRARLAGDRKLVDRLHGMRLFGSDETRLYIGPELKYDFHKNLALQLVSDFPILVESAKDRVVPRYRLLFSLIGVF